MPALVDNELTDPDPHVRWRACLALASQGDPAALPPLHKLLESEPAQIVVEHAERAVARLEGRG